MPDFNWFKRNPFFKNRSEFDKFAEAMVIAADEGNLPIAFQHPEPEEVTLYDVKEFSKRFSAVTGLHIEFSFTTCNHCNKLHCCVIVDEIPEEKESDNNDRNEAYC